MAESGKPSKGKRDSTGEVAAHMLRSFIGGARRLNERFASASASSSAATPSTATEPPLTTATPLQDSSVATPGDTPASTAADDAATTPVAIQDSCVATPGDTPASTAADDAATTPAAMQVSDSDESTGPVLDEGSGGVPPETAENQTAAAAQTSVDEQSTSSGPPVAEVGTGEPPKDAHPIRGLGGDDARWYFSDPGTHIGVESTHHRTWAPFCTHDSKALEAAYQKLQEDVPWTTLAGQAASDHSGDEEQPPSPPTDSDSDEDEAAVTHPHVPVRGGLFDVDVVTREAIPAYWDAEPHKVMRATWFQTTKAGKGEPLEESVAAAIESVHLGIIWHSHLRFSNLSNDTNEHDTDDDLGAPTSDDASAAAVPVPTDDTVSTEANPTTIGTATDDVTVATGESISAMSIDAPAKTPDEALAAGQAAASQAASEIAAASSVEGSAAVISSHENDATPPKSAKLMPGSIATRPLSTASAPATEVKPSPAPTGSDAQHQEVEEPPHSAPPPSSSSLEGSDVEMPAPTAEGRSSAAAAAASDAVAASTVQSTGSKTTEPAALHETRLANGQLVIWATHTDVRLCSATFRTLSLKSALAMSVPLTRGYAGLVDKEGGPLDEEHCSCGVPTRLILVMHGVGQANERTAEDNAYCVRNMCSQLCRKGTLGPRFQSGEERFEVLPVNWRTTLTLNHETVSDITPSGLEWARGILNNVALDVLYFTSPRYSQEIIDTVTDKMNAVYNEFVRRNPAFIEQQGTVAFYSHSLGGVISYEILNNQESAINMADDGEEVRAEAARINQLRAELDGIRARQRRRERSREKQAQERQDGAERESRREERQRHNKRIGRRLDDLGALAEDAAEKARGCRGSAGRLPSARRPAAARRNRKTSSLTFELADVDDLPDDDTVVFSPKELHAQTMVFSRLNFRVAHLFAAGSPIAIFLTLRGASSRPEMGCHGASLLPRDTRVFNLFHSVDPLAYRMEPLLVLPDKVQPPVEVKDALATYSFIDTTNAIRRVSEAAESFFSRFSMKAKKSTVEREAQAAAAEPTEQEQRDAEVEEKRKKLEAVAPEGRVDFVLESSALHSYTPTQVMHLRTSHTHYWVRYDMLNFITQVMLNDTSATPSER